jgi:hypothetical protein
MGFLATGMPDKREGLLQATTTRPLLHCVVYFIDNHPSRAFLWRASKKQLHSMLWSAAANVPSPVSRFNSAAPGQARAHKALSLEIALHCLVKLFY